MCPDFKIGDTVLRVMGGSNDGWNVGEEGVIEQITYGGDHLPNGKEVFSIDVIVSATRLPSRGNSPVNLQIIKTSSSKKGMENLTEKFILAFKSEPEKTFIKAGITDNNGFLTEEGRKLFWAWLLKQNGDDFKKEVVDPLLAEDKDA